MWLRRPLPGLLKAILAQVIVLKSLLNLSLCVHNKRPVLNHWLVQRLPADEDKPQRVPWPVPDTEAVAGAKNKRVMAWRGGGIWIAEDAFTFDDVNKRVPGFGDGLVELGSWLHCEVEIHCWRSSVDWGLDTECFACDDSDVDPVFLDLGYVFALQFLIPRLNPVSVQNICKLLQKK